MDKATLYASCARLAQGASGLAAMGAAAAILSPTRLGVFFTISSLMQIQASAELGMSVVLVQVASHESAAYGADGAAELPAGHPATARIGSLLRLSTAWTALASALFLVVLMPVGWWFFRDTTDVHSHAQAPWLLAVAATALGLVWIPMLAVLEGCGAIVGAWRIRCWQQLIGGLALPAALVAGCGMWSLGIAGLVSSLVTVIGIGAQGGRFSRLWRERSAGPPIDWWRDVWPFQWKVSLSYLSGIFIFYFAVPSVYRICGAVEAGRFGLSSTALRAVSAIAIANVTSKAQILGSLIASGRRADLDQRFNAAFRRSMLIGLLGMVAVVAGFRLVPAFLPQWGGKVLAIVPLTVLAAAMMCQHATNCIATYLRAHREEPLLAPSLIGAGLLGVGFPLAAHLGGVLGVTICFLVTTAILGTGVAYLLLHRKRQAFSAPATLAG